MTKMSPESSLDYRRIEQAITYLGRHAAAQPGLEDLARHLKLSPFHVQRIFHRWAGVTPKQFLSYLTLGRAKTLLAESKNILETSLDTGLSGPGRLHDLFVTIDAVTPGEFKNQGEGLTLSYGIHPTRFGPCLIATTPRGICHLSFSGARLPHAPATLLEYGWKKAKFEKNQGTTGKVIAQIFGGAQKAPLPLFLRGTNFQLKVWEALLRIPAGRVVSYEDLAGSMGRPEAARAASSAVGDNPVAYLIPCHRVIHKSGVMDGYRWGSERKKAMLIWESAVAVNGRGRERG